jgi:DNA-binding beta-propeller fold protein YncE
MAAEARNGSLLYVSSVLTGDVYVYSYSTQKLVGTLTGFTQPYGLCADKAGNVWVVNDGASQLVEYAHGGSTPIATLSDTGEYPEGCSVDAVTGNLAVTNFYSTSGAGSVSIYAAARGTPQIYSDPAIVNYRFCGYDARGNLFVDGANSSSAFVFAELPKGKPATSSFVSVNGPSVTVVRPPSKRKRAPFELACRPSPASSTPSFASCSLNLPISLRSSLEGITPASLSLLAFTRTANLIENLLY